MKQKIVIAITIITLLVCVFGVYINLKTNQLPEDEIQKYFGINKYTILEKKQVNHQLYLKININKRDGEKIFNFYKKSLESNKISVRRFENEFIKYQDGSWYYYNDKVNQMYGYVIISISKSMDQIELYELFGD